MFLTVIICPPEDAGQNGKNITWEKGNFYY